MLESITERIARERAELAKAALEREAANPGRNMATTFSEKTFARLLSREESGFSLFFFYFAC